MLVLITPSVCVAEKLWFRRCYLNISLRFMSESSPVWWIGLISFFFNCVRINSIQWIVWFVQSLLCVLVVCMSHAAFTCVLYFHSHSQHYDAIKFTSSFERHLFPAITPFFIIILLLLLLIVNFFFLTIISSSGERPRLKVNNPS